MIRIKISRVILFSFLLFEKLAYGEISGSAYKELEFSGSSNTDYLDDDDENEFGEKVKTRKNPDKNLFKKMEVGEIKEIEVNSVHFIRLPEKASEVFIPDPGIVDVQMLSDTTLYLIGLAPGTTTLVINGKSGNILVDCNVKVTYPIKTIKSAIKNMYPDTNVEIVSLDKSVLLRGRVPSPQVAADAKEIVSQFVGEENIINKLDIETATQVLLKVKIAEVTRDVTKGLGIHWRALSGSKGANGMAYGLAFNTASNFGNLSSSTSINTSTSNSGQGDGANNGTTSTTTSSSDTSMKSKFLDTTLSTSLEGTRWLIYHNSGSNALGALIDALASESFASVLAEPTLVAMSGTKATFSSGGEFGYRVLQGNDSSSATTEFKNWGTSIEFTPVVISEDRINITVTPKVSTLASTQENQPPALLTKEATTTIELGSGQSFAIAGLLQTSINNATVQTPGLSSIPFLGALFRTSKILRSEKELVIIVTPYIVKPSSKSLKLPTDMIPKMFSPLESILERKFHRTGNMPRRVTQKKKLFTAGFSLK